MYQVPTSFFFFLSVGGVSTINRTSFFLLGTVSNLMISFVSNTINSMSFPAPTFAQDDVVIVEHPDMQDGSTKPWPPEVISSHVRDFVKKSGIKTVRSWLVCVLLAAWRTIYEWSVLILGHGIPAEGALLL